MDIHTKHHTTRELVHATSVGVRPRREGARRVGDNIVWYKVTSTDTGHSRLTASDSHRTYRLDADDAVELAHAILHAFEDGDANADD